jgi:hypothetical protein
MRNVLLSCALLAALAVSGPAVLAQTGSTVPAPPPPTLLPLVSPSTACLTNCDTSAMNCQTACVPSLTSTAAPGACNNACTTQQLVCKQGCPR